MAFVYYAIILVHVLTCLFLIGVVLLQQGKGQDLASAFGGGVTQTAFGPRGSANILSRATAILAGLFMVTSLLLSVVHPRSGGFLEQMPAQGPAPAASGAPAGKAPAGQPAPAQQQQPAKAPAPAK